MARQRAGALPEASRRRQGDPSVSRNLPAHHPQAAAPCPPSCFRVVTSLWDHDTPTVAQLDFLGRARDIYPFLQQIPANALPDCLDKGLAYLSLELGLRPGSNLVELTCCHVKTHRRDEIQALAIVGAIGLDYLVSQEPGLDPDPETYSNYEITDLLEAARTVSELSPCNAHSTGEKAGVVFQTLR